MNPISEEILFGNDYDATPAVIATGDISIVKENDALTLAAAGDTSFRILQQCVEDGKVIKRLSEPILKGKLKSYSRTAFAAAVSKQVTLGLAGLVPVVGQEYSFQIYRSDFEIYQTQLAGYIPVVADTAVLADLVAKLVAQVNATTINHGITAVNAAPNIVLNAPDAYTLFSVFLVQNLFGTTITVNQDPDPGNGNYVQVLAKEKIYKGNQGVLNNVFAPVEFNGNTVYYSNPAKQYDLYVFEHYAPSVQFVGGTKDRYIRTILALDTTAAAKAALNTLLETTLDVDQWLNN